MQDTEVDAIRTFMQAVYDGDVDAVRQMHAEDGTLVHEIDPIGCCDSRPLNIAAGRGDEAMVLALLECGADINAKSDWWAGPFAPIHSILWAHTSLGPLLIRHGATVDVHAAAGLGMLDVLSALLDEDPDLIRARGGDGQFPLHFAANPEVAGFLLNRGAEIDARDIDHVSTAAQHALRSRPDVARFLIEQGCETDFFMLTALGDAARMRDWLARDPEALTRKLTRDAFPSPGSEGGHIYIYHIGENGTPLHAAVRCDQPDAIRLLLEAGCPPGIRGDYDDCSPLHIAAWDGRPAAASQLLDAGADLEQRSGPKHNNTPLGWAIVSGKIEMVELFIARGAQMRPHYMDEAEAGIAGEFRSFSGATAEQFARIARLLKKAGAP